MVIHYLSVQALTKYIKRKFEADPHLREVYVKGELSNVKLHNSGHIYFTLKDEHAQIQSVMYKMQAKQLAFKPENGMNVLIRGDVNVYEVAGRYQMYAKEMQPDGVGSLHVAYEQLKKELAARGYFKPEFKQPIPKFPKRIGVITAKTGAAIRDILSTLKRHYPIAEVVVIPTAVQGKVAANDIAQAIALANQQGNIDTLIVGRGGGSIEDLWAFNEEVVAQAIFESRIPIISAVGHETDTTIADYVADLRAPTPTGAAKMAVPDRFELLQHVESLRTRLIQQTQAQLKHERARLTRVQSAYPMLYPERLYRPFVEQLAQLDDRMQRAAVQAMEQQRYKWQHLEQKLQIYNPLKEIVYEKKRIESMQQILTRAIAQKLQQERQHFTAAVHTLEMLNPLSIMTRGYAIAYDDQKIVKSVDSLEEGQKIDLQFTDGRVQTIVQSIQKEEEST